MKVFRMTITAAVRMANAIPGHEDEYVTFAGYDAQVPGLITFADELEWNEAGDGNISPSVNHPRSERVLTKSLLGDRDG